MLTKHNYYGGIFQDRNTFNIARVDPVESAGTIC